MRYTFGVLAPYLCLSVWGLSVCASAATQITATWDTQRFQTEGDTLRAIEEITLRNASDPPQTLLKDRPFEIQLPPEAVVVAGSVQSGSGRPVALKPQPGGQGRHYFFYPLLPGDTRFAGPSPD